MVLAQRQFAAVDAQQQQHVGRPGLRLAPTNTEASPLMPNCTNWLVFDDQLVGILVGREFAQGVQFRASRKMQIVDRAAVGRPARRSQFPALRGLQAAVILAREIHQPQAAVAAIEQLRAVRPEHRIADFHMLFGELV